MKKILFVVTSAGRIGAVNYKTGYEFSEVADPYFEFINAGLAVRFASIDGGTPPMDGYDPSRETSATFFAGNGLIELNASLAFQTIQLEDYDAIFFPGGLGPMIDVFNNPDIKGAIHWFNTRNKTVGAVCHGPVALLNVKLDDGSYLLHGRRVTSFTRAEEELKGHSLNDIIPFYLDNALKDQGAIFSCVAPFQSHIVVDGRIVTGQNPASASGVAREMMRLLDEVLS